MIRFFHFFFIFYLLTAGVVWSYDYTKLSLDDAIKIAEQNNYEIFSQDQELKSRKYSKGSHTANYYPQVNLTAIYPFYGRSSAFTVDQMIFDFGKLGQRINAGKYAIKAMEYVHAQRRDTIMNELVMTFYEILKTKNSISQQEKEILLNNDLLKQAKAFFDAGRVSSLDITKQRIALNESELRLVIHQGRLLKLEEELFNHLGVAKPPKVAYIPDYGYEKMDLNADLIIDSNIHYIHSVKAMEMKILGIKAQISAYKRDFLPSIMARAAYRFEGRGVPDSDKDNDYIAGIGMTWQIFNGGRTYYQIQEHKAILNSLYAKLAVLKRKASSKIRYGIIDADTAYLKINVRKEGVNAAKVYYEYTKTKLNVGEASEIEFFQASHLLGKQERDYKNAIYNYKIKIARLEKLAGLIITK